MREELLEFTECMRDHGIDMPDPVFGDDGRVTMEATPGERVGPGAEDEDVPGGQRGLRTRGAGAGVRRR